MLIRFQAASSTTPRLFTEDEGLAITSSGLRFNILYYGSVL